MSEVYRQFGWCLLAVAALFTLGLSRRFSKRFYPDSPGFAVRLAAPLIFLALAIVCLAGYGFEALVFVAVVGATISVWWRWRLLGKANRTA